MKATLCDICGKMINSIEVGGRVTEVGNVNKKVINDMDLCATHYYDYSTMRRVFVINAKKAAK